MSPDAITERLPAGVAPSGLAPGMPAAEWQARVELAACYRLFARFGWHELIYNHITLRVPGTADQFLINPFGLMYREVTAANLVRIDTEGNALSGGAYGVNPAGFIVHRAVHMAREDAHCVMHTHTTAGLAVACQQDGLLPISFPAVFFTDRLAYHDFEGITLEREECARLAASLGTRNAMILRNHGLLTCGPTVADAFSEMYQLQRACEVQVAALAGGRPIRTPPASVAHRAAAQFDALSRQGAQNALLFAAMLRWVEEAEPDFRG
jgi:ribulose-5-phosphate 4-epimerase/fuculose-1-phosphate aldolase